MTPRGSQIGARTGTDPTRTLSLTTGGPLKRRVDHCPGPKVWWCPVENCTTEHPPRPGDADDR